ncbi:hypothetical protein [Bdellovibrio svalbardensis]|uniref:Peptidase M48 domain-containing protein n=1 Tax=Bdellovibrio svalbardensis TaxID=2972972 RepID=A0ABT6DEW6_9BACT|nr:hypothetical protein [Bdellovibrio svalbardensis]MDG0815377.1 hypothetical protein [Bdellovibrio svalbardensis]
MKGLRAFLPYILASLLLALLVTMAQATKDHIRRSRPVNAQESARSDYFYLPVGSANVSDVSERDYLEVISDFQSHYMQAVIARTGKPLIIPNEWASPYFAAFAMKKESFMQISLWGGMARAPGVTKPMLAAVICHELGHILGGDPLQTIPGSEWASTEGQSDFFAAKVCLPEYLQRHSEAVPLATVNSQVLQICGDHVDCEKVAQIGWDLVNMFQRYSYRKFVPVQLDVEEKAATELILNTYPSDQCRLDTYIEGARCQLGQKCRAPLCWLPAEH